MEISSIGNFISSHASQKIVKKLKLKKKKKKKIEILAILCSLENESIIL